MAVHAQSNIQLNTIPAYTSLLGGHFVYRAHGTPGTPASANVVESSINLSNPAQWGYNTHIGANGIKLRYNENDLSEWSTNGLTFYKPGSIDRSLQLSTTDLKFFKPDSYQLTTDSVLDNSKNYYTRSGEGTELSPYVYTIVTEPDVASIDEYYEQTTAATLNALGLNITEGSITLGELEDNIYPFRVNSEGYLTAREGWIGGIDSYVKLEKDEETNSHYLDVRLSQLDMLLGGDLYGQENIVDVLDIVAQQSDFIRLWTGEQVWLYYKDGEENEPYTVYQYTNNETGEIKYYYDENQFIEGSYILTEDTSPIENKDYYQLVEGKYKQVENVSGDPHGQGYYELIEESWVEFGDIYILVEDPEENPQKEGYYEFDEDNQQYVLSKDTVVVENKKYYLTYPSISIAGLSQSLKFTDDSLGNQQKLIVSSANDTEDEKAKVEIDPQYLKFLIESNNNLPLELSLNYDGEELDTNSLSIKSGEEEIFSIEDEYGYALNTTTGFKAGPIGMFHYKNGLAIGLM